MSTTPLSPTRLFTCTACGAVLPVGPELLGKSCRCGRCGKVNQIEEEATERRKQTRRAKQQRIGFFCRVCDTRMIALEQHVGRKAKCPDCGALTKVPPPPKPRPKQKPKAMHGQQYGVWGVDEAPDPDEIRAQQPKYFPVWCRVCDTLMHARPQQIGKKLVCPDCGGKTVVEEPPKPKAKKSPLVPDGQEYQLDAKQELPTRPDLQFKPPEPTAKEYEAKREPIRQERTDRPKVPSLPTVQGVSKMLLCMPVVPWFVWLSGVGVLVGGFMMLVVGLHPIAAIPFFVAAGLSAVMELGALSALCLALLTESSEGNDRLHNPPGPVFLDWAGDLFYLAISGSVALAPWWLVGRLLDGNLPLEYQGLVMLVGTLFTFPLLLLSSLENGSPLEPFSPRMMGSVGKRPAHWLLLVLQSIAIVGGTGFAAAAVLAKASAVSLLAIPIFIGGCLLYFRVLGRFAWWLSESLAKSE